MTKFFPRFLLITVLCLVLFAAFSIARLPVSMRAEGLNSSNTNWPTYGFDQDHTYYNPDETTINPGNVSQLTLTWSQSIKPTTAPTVVNNVLYVGAFDHNVYAFNATTGAKLWSFQTNGPVYAAPVVVNGVLYVGSDDHNVYALNAATGAKLWSFATKKAVRGAPDVVNGVAYVTSLDGNAYALNSQTGAMLWQKYIGSDNGSSPTVDDGMVFVASHTFDDRFHVRLMYLFGLNAATGARVWRKEIETTGATVDSTPTFVNGIVYLSAGQTFGFCGNPASDSKPDARAQNIMAFQATTGAVIWHALTTSGCPTNSTAVAYGFVYFVSVDGNAYERNASNGAGGWLATVGNGSPIDYPLTVANGIVYLSDSAGYVYGLDATTGAQLWSYNIGAESYPITIVNGMVYVTSSTLQAFALPGGTR